MKGRRVFPLRFFSFGNKTAYFGDILFCIRIYSVAVPAVPQAVGIKLKTVDNVSAEAHCPHKAVSQWQCAVPVLSGICIPKSVHIKLPVYGVDRTFLLCYNFIKQEEGYFDENCVGEFWLILETRPYMRLLMNYVETLMECCKMRCAAEVCEKMLLPMSIMYYSLGI